MGRFTVRKHQVNFHHFLAIGGYKHASHVVPNIRLAEASQERVGVEGLVTLEFKENDPSYVECFDYGRQWAEAYYYFLKELPPLY